MSIESTQEISRDKAERWAAQIYAEEQLYFFRIRFVPMSDKELEDWLYEHTRKSNKFDNFKII